MIKVEVKSSAVAVKRGTSARTNKAYEIFEQEAWAFLQSAGGGLAPYPSRIIINLEPAQPPYPEGTYTVEPSCVYVGKFGSLMLSDRLKLKPMGSAAPVRSAA